MKQFRSKTLIPVITVIGFFCSAALAVNAAWKKTGETGNIITTGVCRNEIREIYTQPEPVQPSQRITKEVSVVNTGTVDTIVRVRLEPQFGEWKADGTFLSDTFLDTDMIELSCNKELWKEKDGYYYYLEPLKAGEETKEPLLNSFTLSEKAGNDYRGKDARILVYLESIQAQANAVGLWGISTKELGFSVKNRMKLKNTSVSYLGKEDGFNVSLEKTDLFANFKELLPGCSREQIVEIYNESEDDAEIFLKAEYMKQERMTEEETEALERLMNQYARIKITENGKVLYSGSISGKSQKQVSLGSYKPGEKRNLHVKLSVSPEMDNECQSLTGKVKWVFTVAGEDTEGASVYPA